MEEEVFIKPDIKDVEVKVVGKIDLDSMNQRTRPPKKTREQIESERRNRIRNHSVNIQKHPLAEEAEDGSHATGGQSSPQLIKGKSR